MNESEVVRQLSRRTCLPEVTTSAVFNALRELVLEGAVDAGIFFPGYSEGGSPAVPDGSRAVASERIPIVSQADPRLVDDLIARARIHPLGVDFLLGGFLGSVAAAFGAHAFTVEAAREKLRSERKKITKEMTTV